MVPFFHPQIRPVPGLATIVYEVSQVEDQDIISLSSSVFIYIYCSHPSTVLLYLQPRHILSWILD